MSKIISTQVNKQFITILNSGKKRILIVDDEPDITLERRQTNYYGKAIQQHAVHAGEADCRPIKDFRPEQLNAMTQSLS